MGPPVPVVILKQHLKDLNVSLWHQLVWCFITTCSWTSTDSYIKEFVHGDFGRTKPNLCELLRTDTDILELDVEVGGLTNTDTERKSSRVCFCLNLKCVYLSNCSAAQDQIVFQSCRQQKRKGLSGILMNNSDNDWFSQDNVKPSLKWFHLKGAESVVCLCLCPVSVRGRGLASVHTRVKAAPPQPRCPRPVSERHRDRAGSVWEELCAVDRVQSVWGCRRDGAQLVGEETWTRVSQSCWCWEARSVCVLVLDLPFWLFLQFNHQETCCSVTLCYKTQICSQMKFV